LEYTNLADIYFIENPEYIHYRLDAETVSKELLDQVFISITPDKAKNLKNYVVN